MFKTIAAVALLAATLPVAAADLTNDSVVGPCETVECALADAGISYIGARPEGVSEFVLTLMKQSDRYRACNIAALYGVDTLIYTGGQLEQC